MNPQARRFALLTLGITLGLLCAIGPLNYLVDPYNRFGNNRMGVFISAEREAKPMLMRHWPHDALIVGNSRMAWIPVKNIRGFHFFNAGFAGATPDEVYYFLRWHAAREKVVIFGVDIGQLDPATPKGDQFAPLSIVDALSNVFNIETTRHSFNAISKYLAGHAGFLETDGSIDLTVWRKQFDRYSPEEQHAIRDRDAVQLMNGYDQFEFAGPEKGRMEFFKKIKEDLRRKGILCVVVIPPVFSSVAEHIKKSRAFPAFELWKRDLKSIFPTVIDLSFSAYSAPENFYSTDPRHYTSALGEKMINKEVIPVVLALMSSPETDQKKTEASVPSGTPRQ